MKTALLAFLLTTPALAQVHPTTGILTRPDLTTFSVRGGAAYQVLVTGCDPDAVILLSGAAGTVYRDCTGDPGNGFYWTLTASPSVSLTLSVPAGAIVVVGVIDLSGSNDGCWRFRTGLQADLDNNGHTDQKDLDLFLRWLAIGDWLGDVDDGSGSGVPDGGLTIEDQLYFLHCWNRETTGT